MKQDKFIKWIKVQIEHYLPILGLSAQRVDVEFSEKTNFLEITCTYPYLDPTIRFSEKALKDWSDGKMKPDRILHELCHILTDPLYCKAIDRHAGKTEIEDERERLTDTITVIIRNLDV